MDKLSDRLNDKLKQLPELPGIYKMLDSKGNIIYIGKSKCLKKRVSSYFVNNPKWEKAERMASFIDDFEITVTDTHLEARLLECELIKTLKPVFNSQMKHDQGYVYIRVMDFNIHNPLSIIHDRTDHSFGPFRSRFALGEFIDTLRNVYPIEKKNRRYEFEYHLFPTVMDKKTYKSNREILIELFSDDKKISLFIRLLEQKMKEAASQSRYETASKFRDMMEQMTVIKHGINGYRELAVKNILLTIPYLLYPKNVPTDSCRKGFKLFYISGGFIRNKKQFTSLSDRDIDGFIRESCLLDPIPAETNEKSAIDFRDILYSEIISLPEEMVRLL